MKAYTCSRLTAVAVMLVGREFSLLNVYFQRNYGEKMNGLAGIVGTIKIICITSFISYLSF